MAEILHFEICENTDKQTNTQTDRQTDMGITIPRPPPMGGEVMGGEVISEWDTYRVLSNLNVSKSTGPDGIGNRILKETAPSICGPLSKLFQNTIDRGEYPESWKQAGVSALHKKGSVHDCNNYRPISLLSCISKVFEKLVFKHIYTYLTRHNISLVSVLVTLQ